MCLASPLSLPFRRAAIASFIPLSPSSFSLSSNDLVRFPLLFFAAAGDRRNIASPSSSSSCNIFLLLRTSALIGGPNLRRRERENCQLAKKFRFNKEKSPQISKEISAKQATYKWNLITEVVCICKCSTFYMVLDSNTPFVPALSFVGFRTEGLTAYFFPLRQRRIGKYPPRSRRPGSIFTGAFNQIVKLDDVLPGLRSDTWRNKM